MKNDSLLRLPIDSPLSGSLVCLDFYPLTYSLSLSSVRRGLHCISKFTESPHSQPIEHSVHIKLAYQLSKPMSMYSGSIFNLLPKWISRFGKTFENSRSWIKHTIKLSALGAEEFWENPKIQSALFRCTAVLCRRCKENSMPACSGYVCLSRALSFSRSLQTLCTASGPVRHLIFIDKIQRFGFN